MRTARNQSRETYLLPVMSELRPLLGLLFDDVSITFDKYSLCIEALKDGRVEAVTTDNVILLGFINDDPANLKLVNKPFTTEPYGIGLNHDDAALRNKINDVLQGAATDGTWKKIYDGTLGKSGSPADPPQLQRY